MPADRGRGFGQHNRGQLEIGSLGEVGEAIGGYFLLRADEKGRALEIAATCPHLQHGGRLEVRELER